MSRPDALTRREVLAALASLGAIACAGPSTGAADPRRAATESKAMKVGHVYATEDGESHIGELDIDLAQNEGRPLFSNSGRFEARDVGFQTVRAGGATDGHRPSERRLYFVLAGTWEILTSDGARREFPVGSISLVEDTTGKGHRGRVVGDADVLVASVTLKGKP